mgnify:FL=1|tara:strand:+ start:872 stop:1075 length:204 start_codon:yes stop_codon:yes gene_type:complete
MKLKGNPNYDDDYTVKNGRLINNAPDLTTGLWKMAQARKALKKAEKVNIIVEANEISNMRIDLDPDQ